MDQGIPKWFVFTFVVVGLALAFGALRLAVISKTKPALLSDAWFDEKPIRRLFRRVAILIFEIGLIAGVMWLWTVLKNGPAH